MKLRWKIVIGIVLLILGLSAFDSLTQSAARQAVAETRQALREQGFKTDLAEFDFSTTPELRRREQALTNASSDGMMRKPEDYARHSLLLQAEPNLMESVTSESALVVWKQERLESLNGEDFWPNFQESFNEQRKPLDLACIAALSGPIRFDLNASHGMAMRSGILLW